MRMLIQATASFALAVSMSVAAAVPQMLVVPPTAKAGGGNAPGARSLASPIAFNADAMLKMRPGEEADVSLPSGRAHRVVMEKALRHEGRDASWVGYLRDHGKSNRVIVTQGPAGAYGVIEAPEGTYRIVPGSGHDWLVDMQQESQLQPPFENKDDGRVVFTHDAPAPDLRQASWMPAELPTSGAKATPTPQVVVDIMFVVTQGAATKLGANLTTRLNFLVTRANTAYADSEVAITLRKVNQTVVNFPDNNDDDTALDSITPLCGTGVPGSFNCGGVFNATAFGNIETIRTQSGADVVHFMRNGSDFGGSGVAWVPTPNPVSGLMYSTVQGCMSACESVFIHEVGHNMGNMHDRPTVAWQRGGIAEPLPANAQGFKPYSYGFAFCKSGLLTCNPNAAGGCASQPECSTNDPNNFSEIMAYFHGSTDRIYKFSNPAITCRASGSTDGVQRPCGVNAGNSVSANPLLNPADTAQSMNLNRAALSAVKATTVGASLQFTQGTFSAAEAAGLITFIVSRTGDSSGAVSVNYTVTGGTAIAGVDFTATSGTLNWAAGDTANKTFTVTVANDGLSEGIESFTATLSNPVGTPAAVLGSPSTAAGLITEPWPPGGAFPAGFTNNPAGSSVGWATAADFSSDGDNASLKSGAINFNVANCFDPDFNGVGANVPCPSKLQWQGTLAAGVIAFSYQVNSYPSFGFFEFLIDGTVVLTDSGLPGAKSFSTTVAAGAHTLVWQYRPALPFACANTNPPPPQGNTCADRAWIDAVSLPLALAASTTSLTGPASSQAGSAVTFTATVSGAAGTPTGTVQFRDGTTTITGCGSVALGVSATAGCTTSTLTGGAHNITAVYSGSGTYQSSTSAAVLHVVALGPQLLAATPATLDFGGQSMNTTSPSLSTTVRNTSGASVTPSTVTVSTGYVLLGNTCTAALAPAATCTITVGFQPNLQGVLPGAITVSYAGGGPTVVALTGVGERSLVTHYYRAILRRAPDAGGKAFWDSEASRVQALGANVNEVWFSMAQGFFRSGEYLAFNRDVNGYVTDLYNTFFNRAPDAAGQAFWVGQINAGLPREIALLAFMFSAEFKAFTEAIFGAPNVRREIDTVVDFYRGLLARLPDDGGFNFWVARFRAAQCQGAAAVSAQAESISSQFAQGAEYAQRARNNAQYVGDLYNAFLRREGDLGGVNFWVNTIATNALTREQVRQQFIASPEFGARVQAVIAQGCL